jgi:hypothetical protein
MPAQPAPGWTGSALTFLGRYSEANQNRPQPEPLLLYGQVLIDSTTGEVLGDLGVNGAIAQRYTPDSAGDIVELVVPDAHGARQVVLVKLKPENIAENIRLAGRSR